MCDPLTIAGLAASAAGAAASYTAQSQVADARNAVLQNERALQAPLNDEAAGVNKTSLDRFSDVPGQQATDATRLTNLYKDNTNTPAPSFMPKSNSDITNTEIANKSAIAKNFTNQQGDALGKVRSFGDVMGENNRGLAADTQHIGQIGNFEQGNAGTTPYALNEANQAGNGAALAGNILSGVGKIGVTAGLSGGASKLAGMFGPAAPLSLAAPAAVGSGVSAGTNFVNAGVSPFSLY